MPYDDPDPVDPMTITGVAFETSDDSAVREMAACMIEEYLRLGFDEDRLLKMFRVSGYVGPYMAYQALGEEAIRAMIAEYAGLRLRPPERLELVRRGDGGLGLPVIE